MASFLSKVKTAHQRRKAFWEIHTKSRLLELRLIWDMNRNKDWVRLGFDSWGAFCEAPEASGGLAISREWATQLVKVYQTYVITHHVAEQHLLEASPRKLYALIPQVNEENLEEVIEKAKTLSLRDIEIDNNGGNEIECSHENIKTLYHCEHCNTWFRTNPHESNH